MRIGTHSVLHGALSDLDRRNSAAHHDRALIMITQNGTYAGWGDDRDSAARTNQCERGVCARGLSCGASGAMYLLRPCVGLHSVSGRISSRENRASVCRFRVAVSYQVK